MRFVEVSRILNFLNGTGWDTHNEGHLNQHLLIRELDHALVTLIGDLRQHKLLDKTLIAVGMEFGCPAKFDGGRGRGQHSKCFSLLLAGGELNHAGAYGVSYELAENSVTLSDYHATTHAALGIDPDRNFSRNWRVFSMRDFYT